MDLPNHSVDSSGVMSGLNGGTFSFGSVVTVPSFGCSVDEFGMFNRILTSVEWPAVRATTDYLSLPFAADLIDAFSFDNNLNSVRGTHNGTATTPIFIQNP
jgi:hypothetical protein